MAVKAIKIKKSVLESIKKLLLEFQEKRELQHKLANEDIPNMQKELVAAIAAIDPDNHGVVFTDTEGQESAAFVQQNGAPQFWDTENLVPWLQQNKTRWMACSSRTFDPVKFESEIASGNIPAKTVAKFKKSGNPPKPFIRFGKPKKNSMR